MRIVMDLTALLPEATGIDTYLNGLVRQLAESDRENRYRICINIEDRNCFAGSLPDNFSTVALCTRSRLSRLLFQQILLPALAARWHADVVHSPVFIAPLWRGRQRHLITIHDMTFFSLPAYHIPLRRSFLFRFAVKRSIRRAHLVLTPSRFAAQQIMDYVPEVPSQKLRVVPHGLNEEFRLYAPEEIHAHRARLRLPADYILYVGTIEPRKNLSTLLEAYMKWVRRTPGSPSLVIAGRLGWDYGEFLSQVDSPELRGRVHLPGYVPQPDLPWFYAAASMFVYPSIQEGFGFPPLEAMACGIPVISSNTSSLVEILHGAAELVDTQNTEALTDAMEKLGGDSAHRECLRKKGLALASRYRWDETARTTLQCYRELASNR